MTNHRVLGAAEARMLFMAGLALLAIAGVGIVWPLVLTAPFAVLGAWMGSTLLLRALRLLRHRDAAAVPALPESQVAPRGRRKSNEVIVDVASTKLPADETQVDPSPP
jgi:hypothetical protein